MWRIFCKTVVLLRGTGLYPLVTAPSATQQLPSARLPFSESTERKALRVALHNHECYRMSYVLIHTWLSA